MAFKTVLLMAVACLLVTAKGSYLDEEFKEKAVYSKSVVHASAPAPPKSPTPAPPVVTPSTPVYKPPVKTPPSAPPVNPPTPAPPVYKPPTPAPPVYKPPSPSPPPPLPPVKPPAPPAYKPPSPSPPTPLPPVKPPSPSPPTPAPPAYKPPSPSPPPGPPTTGPMPPPVRTRQDCTPLCEQRCKLHSRKKLCARACMTCCDRCKCVPPGTYGNREKCGKCYTDMTTRRNKPKCP